MDLDNKDAFVEAWAGRRFLYLASRFGTDYPSDTERVVTRRLHVHWDQLEEEARDFYLAADPVKEPKTVLGLEAARRNTEWVAANHPDYRIGNDLRGLSTVAERFAERKIDLSQYPHVKNLDDGDWYAIRAKIGEVLRHYNLWWSRVDNTTPRPPGLSDFIDGGFTAPPDSEVFWESLTLSLDASTAKDSLLAVDVALSRLWKQAKDAWRKRLASSEDAENDRRVPTFIVVDEAHNFAPELTTDKLRQRVTERLIQIASEGRKYGLYLILATQRPTKLHRSLVPECENSCVLRVQSELETTFASSVLGIPQVEVSNVPRFVQGQGLLTGRWVGSETPVNVMIAPARSTVGGGGLGNYWTQAPTVASAPESINERADAFISHVVEESAEPIDLASLAWRLYDEFDEIEPGDWLGFGGLTEFLRSLPLEGIVVEPNVAPGVVYSPDHHAPPEARGQRAVRSGLEILDVARGQIELPLIGEQGYRSVFEALSDEAQAAEFWFSDTSKAVRGETRRRGNPVGRTAINYVINAIMRTGHMFAPDLPQDSKTLASAFVESIAFRLDKAGIWIPAEDQKAFTTYISGGIVTDTDGRPARGELADPELLADRASLQKDVDLGEPEPLSNTNYEESDYDSPIEPPSDQNETNA